MCQLRHTTGEAKEDVRVPSRSGDTGKGPPWGSVLLRELAVPEVELILHAGRRHVFSRGEVVFHEGDYGDAVHLVTRGHFAVQVTIREGKTATLGVMGRGETFGEVALFHPDARRVGRVVALEPGETLSIGREDFQTLRKEDPALTEAVLSILADKVRRYTRYLLEALYVPVQIRVLRRLLELADTYAANSDPIRVTQVALAQMAGTSRATVNRVLRQEQKRGTLELARGRIVLLDRTRLEDRAG